MTAALTPDFWECATQVEAKLEAADHQFNAVSFLPAKLSYLRFIYDPRRMGSEVKTQYGIDSLKRTANVIFDEKDSASNRSEYSRYYIAAISAYQPIKASEELYVNVGSSYIFF